MTRFVTILKSCLMSLLHIGRSLMAIVRRSDTIDPMQGDLSEARNPGEM